MQAPLLYILKNAALAPLQLKRGLMGKAFSRMGYWAQQRLQSSAALTTNLGIKNNVRVRLPLHRAPMHFLFQTPEQYHGEYETLMLCRGLASQSDAFVDIGANWGFYTYYVAASTKTPVHFIEPNPGLFSVIHKNSGQKGLSSYQGYPIAISDVNGKLSFYIDETDDHMSSLMPLIDGHHAKEITVDVKTFETWAQEHNLSEQKLTVKVDVEQAEWNFVKGVGKMWSQISYLIMEVLGPAREGGLINYLIQRQGLHAYYINGLRLESVAAEDQRYTHGQYNWLFCKDDAQALASKVKSLGFTVVPA